MGKKINPITAILVAIVVVAGSFVGYGYFTGKQASVASVAVPTSDSGVALTQCPDDGDTSLTLNVFNLLNETGSENYDITGYLYMIDGESEKRIMSITDTTAPTASTIVCGEKYAFKPVAADGANGDNSRILSVASGDAEVDEDGNLIFVADSSNEYIDVYMGQHGTIEMRAFDNVNNGFMYDNADSSNSDYETTGVTWTSTTNNATAYSEANGLDITFTVRSTGSDTNFNDLGFWILLDDFSTNVWEEPVVKVDGVKVEEASDLMNSDEKKAFDGYEYVYFVSADKDVKDSPDYIEVRVISSLLAGASATADLDVDFQPRGKYLSTNGIDVNVGAVKDDTSQTAVYTRQDNIIDIT